MPLPVHPSRRRQPFRGPCCHSSVDLVLLCNHFYRPALRARSSTFLAPLSFRKRRHRLRRKILIENLEAVCSLPMVLQPKFSPLGPFTFVPRYHSGPSGPSGPQRQHWAEKYGGTKMHPHHVCAIFLGHRVMAHHVTPSRSTGPEMFSHSSPADLPFLGTDHAPSDKGASEQ